MLLPHSEIQATWNEGPISLPYKRIRDHAPQATDVIYFTFTVDPAGAGDCPYGKR